MSRSRRQPTDDWQQLRLVVASPAQGAYELLRPVVLFGQTPAARTRETGVPERTLRRKAAAFDARGMASLFDPPPPVRDRRRLPGESRHAIVALKAEYPSFGPREIARICRRRFGRPGGHHTVERGLAGERAAGWVCGETVTVEYAAQSLAQYQVTFEANGRRIREVGTAQLFPTRFPSP